MKKKIFIVILLVWVALSLSFTARELFRKGQIKVYKKLFSLSLDDKRSLVTGEKLYAFIKFINENLPEGESFKIVGLDEVSHDKKRALYYLYPHLEDEKAGFILVFDSIYTDEGSDVFAKFDDTNYILKKR